MADASELVRRHAEWHRRQRALSWPEKIRLVEAVRESLLQWRRLRDHDASDRVGGAVRRCY